MAYCKLCDTKYLSETMHHCKKTKIAQRQERQESELFLLRSALADKTRELEEATVAIRWMYGYDEPATPSFPYQQGAVFGWRMVGRELPAVRRALGEKEGQRDGGLTKPEGGS